MLPSDFGLTLFILFSGLLLIWQFSGIVMWNAGLVRAKNATDVFSKHFLSLALVFLAYLWIGHFIFAGFHATNHYFPNFFAALNPVNVLRAYNETTSRTLQQAHLFYELLLPLLTVAIVNAVLSERLRTWALLVFVIVLGAVIYPTVGFWVWHGGFLQKIGFVDQCGASVVYLVGAIAAFVGILLVGPRYRAHDRQGAYPLRASNLPLAHCGALFIWIGSFGFHGGIHLPLADPNASVLLVTTFLDTNVAAACGILVAALYTRVLYGTLDMTVILNGFIAGIVAIAAMPITATFWETAFVASLGSLLAVFFVYLFERLGFDDSCGGIASFGVSSVWSLLAVAFCHQGGANVGVVKQFFLQLLGIVTIVVFVSLVSFIVLVLIRLIMGLRIDSEEEYLGLDLTHCGMAAYPEFTISSKL